MFHNLTALRKGLVYVALLLLGNCYLSGQTTKVAPQYRSYEQASRQEVFLDAFDDNRNQWILHANRYHGQFQDGSLTISSDNPKVMIQWKEVQLPKEGDFDISLRIRNVAGTDKSMAGLSFGIHEKGNRFVFWESPKGAFRVSREESGKRYDFQPWRFHKPVHESQDLHLSLQQRDKEWQFFLNGELVAQMPAQPLYGNGIGIAVKGPMVIKVDELRVSTVKRGPPIRDLSGPTIHINSPGIQPNKVFVAQSNHLPISGTVADPAGVQELRLDDQVVSLDKKGQFALDLPLKPGRHEKVLKAIDKAGNLSVFPLQLEYRPPTPSKPAIVTVPVRPQRVETYAQQQATRPGKDYLVLIGVDQYDHWNPLHNAVKDCEDVAMVLSEQYQFSPQNIIRVYNDQASRRGILSEFERLQKQLNPEDNLVIYYAGHGYYDEESGLGYWVPNDAQKGFVPDFIPNSTIHDYLRVIHTKHTLLFADACYAGSLFSAHRGELELNRPSRWAFTSGDIEKVWDGAPGTNSPFAASLIKYLQYNLMPELPANLLIKGVTDLMAREVEQRPVGNPLRRAGDEGGVFVFRRKLPH